MALSRRRLLAAASAVPAAAAPANPIRLLVVTGGHGFHSSFFDIFKADSLWKYEHRAHQEKSTSTVYAQPIAPHFDVVLLYDMPQRINPTEQRHFLQLFQQGKGVIVLHHALCSYRHWDTYNEITGARMRDTQDGAFPPFTFLHDVDFRLNRSADPHPVLDGVPSFDIHDETYGRMMLDGGSNPLFTTSTATSIPVVAWTRTYQLSRLVMIQPGHGPQIFADPHFRRLLHNAVQWVAPRA